MNLHFIFIYAIISQTDTPKILIYNIYYNRIILCYCNKKYFQTFNAHARLRQNRLESALAVRMYLSHIAIILYRYNIIYYSLDRGSRDTFTGHIGRPRDCRAYNNIHGTYTQAWAWERLHDKSWTRARTHARTYVYADRWSSSPPSSSSSSAYSRKNKKKIK